MVAAKHSKVAPTSPAACDVAATSTSKEANASYAAEPQQKGDTRAADGNVDSTVFVRGLALDVLKYEVEERFRRFGHIKACRYLLKDTRMSDACHQLVQLLQFFDVDWREGSKPP